MHIPFLTALVGGLFSARTAAQNTGGVLCTVTASGGDDGPTFVDAVQRCDSVTIPRETTLSIATRMDMTGLKNKNIVCDCVLLCCTDNFTYWGAGSIGNRKIHKQHDVLDQRMCWKM
jgi:galacturan 1,4-alpha-galacturonidase